MVGRQLHCRRLDLVLWPRPAGLFFWCTAGGAGARSVWTLASGVVSSEIHAAGGTDRGIVCRTPPSARRGALHPIAAMMPIGLRRVLRARKIILGDEDLCCFSRGPRERLEFIICRPRTANLGQKSDDVFLVCLDRRRSAGIGSYRCSIGTQRHDVDDLAPAVGIKSVLQRELVGMTAAAVAWASR
jgi:hypothetical protein